MMQLHLVGGFLGSGKTTAIIAACKILIAQGRKVGVVTNDQGKYLVDTSFFQLGDIPAVGVTGGCFCCNFDDLEAQLDYLRTEVRPEVVFAESVGSCGDLVATVIRPMLNLDQEKVTPASFSAFTDSRLLLMRLKGEELPFSDNVVYIFDQQIAESAILVANKRDLLEPDEAAELERLARQRYPQKTVRLQNSLRPQSIQEWVQLIETHQPDLASRQISMDYQRYGDGEAQLAWLDEEMTISAQPGQAAQTVIHLIGAIQEGIFREGAAIGHVKCILSSPEGKAKVSITALDRDSWRDWVPDLRDAKISLMLNARVELPAERLRRLVLDAVERTRSVCQADIREANVDYFHPGFPTPRYRLAPDGSAINS